MPLVPHLSGAPSTGLVLPFGPLLSGPPFGYPLFNGFSREANLRQAEDQARFSRIQAEADRVQTRYDLSLAQVEPLAIMGRDL